MDGVYNDVQQFIIIDNNKDLGSLNFNSQTNQLKYVNIMPTQVPSITVPTPTSLIDERGPEYKWNENSTRILIDFYKKIKNKVGTFEVKSIKIMWVKIAEELRKLNINVTANNCINRWRVIERNYKKYVEDQNKTGRGRKFFEYKTEMEDIYGKKKNVHPELLLGSEDVDTQELCPAEETENESLEKNASSNKVTPSVTPKVNKITNRRPLTIEKMRHDRKAFYDEKLKIDREKLIEMKRRNDLIEEKNAILKKNKCCCQCKMLHET